MARSQEPDGIVYERHSWKLPRGPRPVKTEDSLKLQSQPRLNLTAPACAMCRDMGFTLPPEWEPEAASIPAGILYRYGIPCTCAAGQQFARDQESWNLPITPYREPATSSNRAARFQDPATWEPPAWADPPAPKTAVRDRAPMSSAADILQIKSQQEANRKERQP